jgi:hypothetical protein
MPWYLASPPLWRHSEKTAINKPERDITPWTECTSTLILDFPDIRTVRLKYQSFNHPVYGIFVIECKLTETERFWLSTEQEFQKVQWQGVGHIYRLKPSRRKMEWPPPLLQSTCARCPHAANRSLYQQSLSLNHSRIVPEPNPHPPSHIWGYLQSFGFLLNP